VSEEEVLVHLIALHVVSVLLGVPAAVVLLRQTAQRGSSVLTEIRPDRKRLMALLPAAALSSTAGFAPTRPLAKG
jgi:hypothetical protein